MINEYLQVGMGGLLALLILREVFGFLKNKKKNDNNSTEKAILDELRLQNENHLHSIQTEMGKGFDKMMDCYSQKSDKIIEILSRIEVRLGR